MANSLKQFGPEFARYSRTTQDNGRVEVHVIAVMANRQLLHKIKITHPDGTPQLKNWHAKGEVPLGTTIQQYCQMLVADGYEME